MSDQNAPTKLRELAEELRSSCFTDWRAQKASNQHFMGRASLVVNDAFIAEDNPAGADFTAETRSGKVYWQTCRVAVGLDSEFLAEFDDHEMPTEDSAEPSEDTRLEWYKRQSLVWADTLDAFAVRFSRDDANAELSAVEIEHSDETALTVARLRLRMTVGDTNDRPSTRTMYRMIESDGFPKPDQKDPKAWYPSRVATWIKENKKTINFRV